MKGKSRPIFITGRFRSGTSFLWQLFNHLDGFCAWYEPLHPQLLTAIEHVRAKEDHVGVEDYWSSYRNHPQFKKYYSSDFATEKMYLESQQKYPELKTYINHLIELSGTEVPVLQFNRVDFRLSWLKQQFPTALIVHIERNPIQLYESQRKHIPESYQHDADYWDAYELIQWSYALHEQLPLLFDEKAKNHAFYRFYVIYQLSRQMAKNHADVSIDLDKEVFQSDNFVQKLGSVVGLTSAQKRAINARVHVPELSEFEEQTTSDLVTIMTEVDVQLAAAGLLDGFGERSLTSIKFLHSDFWSKYNDPPDVVEQLKVAASKMVTEVQRISKENVSLNQRLIDAENSETSVYSAPVLEGCFNVNDSVASMLQQMSNLSGQMTAELSYNQQLKLKTAGLETVNQEAEAQHSEQP